MQISATVKNQSGSHQAMVRTGADEQSIAIPAKQQGAGSGVNGGELLFLALATCYCNDIYREAKGRGVSVASVEVEVSGSFGSKGSPAEDIRYRVELVSDAEEKELLDLMKFTDSVAEVHNTLRRGTAVTLDACVIREAHGTE